MNSVSALRREIGFGVLAVASVVAVSVLGQLATFPNLAPWFAGLAKPPFSPPNWIFGPVWTTLYGLMAFAAWRVLRLPPSPARNRALVLFFAQLALNAAWSWMFFAAHSPLLGLLNIIPQFWLIVATVAPSPVSIGSRDGAWRRSQPGSASPACSISRYGGSTAERGAVGK